MSFHRKSEKYSYERHHENKSYTIICASRVIDEQNFFQKRVYKSLDERFLLLYEKQKGTNEVRVYVDELSLVYCITAGMHRAGHVPQHFSLALQSASEEHLARQGNKISGSVVSISGVYGQHPSCSCGQQLILSDSACTLQKPPFDEHSRFFVPHVKFSG